MTPVKKQMPRVKQYRQIKDNVVPRDRMGVVAGRKTHSLPGIEPTFQN
jgi:hypothetical protein